MSGGQWYDHSSGYSFYTMPLTETTAAYHFTNNAGLLALGYGAGAKESYYYLAASAMRSLDMAFYINEVHNQDLPTHPLTSYDLEVRADIQALLSPDPDHIKWYIDGVQEVSATDATTWTATRPNGAYTMTMVVRLADESIKTLESLFIVGVASTVSVCAGTTVTCVATSFNEGDEPEYQWYVGAYAVPGATLSTYEYVPVDGDVVTCRMTSSASCTNIDIVTSPAVSITVNPLPAITLTASPGTICNNGSTTLTATVGAGSTTAMTYTWYNGATFLGTTTVNKYGLSGLTPAGAYTYTVEVLNSNGCIGLSNEEEVRVMPIVQPAVTITVSDNNICSGIPVTLSVVDKENEGSSPTYNWYVGSELQESGNTFTYEPNNNDEVYCILNSTNPCAQPTTAESNHITMHITPMVTPSVNITVTPQP
jgi:hypothetical protein